MIDLILVLLAPVAFVLGLMYATWIFYLAVMSLKRARDAGLLSKTATVLGTPVLIVGLVLDFVLNLFFTVLLWELPRETTVSARLKRHNKTSAGRRLAVARWFEQLLDPFDPSGDHI